MLDFLERTSEFTCAPGAGALLAGRGFLTHDIGVQIARALLRKMIGPGILRALVDNDVDNLRNDVAGALDDNGIADANIAAFTQLLAIAADSLDVILVVQRDVLHDDPTNADRLQLANRRERASAP